MIFVPDDSIRVGGVTDDQDPDGFLGDLVDGAPLNLNSKQEIYVWHKFDLLSTPQSRLQNLRVT